MLSQIVQTFQIVRYLYLVFFHELNIFGLRLNFTIRDNTFLVPALDTHTMPHPEDDL